MSEPDGRGSGLSQAAAETPDQIVTRYDGWVDSYEGDVRSWGYTVPEDLAELVLRSQPVGAILDAGCGTGLIGQALASRSPASELVGIDASAASLEVAAASGAYVSVHEVDLAAELPFDDDTFGALVCGGVLTYLPNAAPVLASFVRVTRPGGTIAVSQRTDLWAERNFDETIERLASSVTALTVGDCVPYLPDLAEYGGSIEVRYVSLVV